MNLKQRVNEFIGFISEIVKWFFDNVSKNKYKDFANDLRENDIITEREYKKIYDLPIRK
jgi:transcriptional regulator CtsR